MDEVDLMGKGIKEFRAYVDSRCKVENLLDLRQIIESLDMDCIVFGLNGQYFGERCDLRAAFLVKDLDCLFVPKGTLFRIHNVYGNDGEIVAEVVVLKANEVYEISGQTWEQKLDAMKRSLPFSGDYISDVKKKLADIEQLEMRIQAAKMEQPSGVPF